MNGNSCGPSPAINAIPYYYVEYVVEGVRDPAERVKHTGVHFIVAAGRGKRTGVHSIDILKSIKMWPKTTIRSVFKNLKGTVGTGGNKNDE